MSLLLDALKKAAQDKEKALLEKTGKSAVQNSVPDESVLDFDLEQVENPLNKSESQHKLEDLPTISSEINTPTSDLHKPVIADATSFKKPKTSPPLALEAIESQANHTSKTQTQELLSDEKVQKPAVEFLKNIDSPRDAAKQKGALDLMINKSRQAHEKQNTIKFTGIGIVVVLILTSAAGYFYLDSGNKFQSEQVNAPLQLTSKPVEEIIEAPVPETAIQVESIHIDKSAAKKSGKQVAVKPVQKQEAAEQQIQMVNFTRQIKADPIETLLSQAYERFNAADYDGANGLYEQVLKREPDNRDAMLGEAAVAIKQQRNEFARQKYLQLIQFDPKDSVARAGLAAVAADANDETQLKLMLREQPEAAHLYFALGNLYASQQRWSEAQQSYFSAWTGDSSNADYAYNLGVSLDRMGKFKAAVSQYQIAMQLSEQKAGSFNAVDVDSRIKAIESMMHE